MSENSTDLENNQEKNNMLFIVTDGEMVEIMVVAIAIPVIMPPEQMSSSEEEINFYEEGYGYDWDSGDTVYDLAEDWPTLDEVIADEEIPF